MWSEGSLRGRASRVERKDLAKESSVIFVRCFFVWCGGRVVFGGNGVVEGLRWVGGRSLGGDIRGCKVGFRAVGLVYLIALVTSRLKVSWDCALLLSLETYVTVLDL